MSARKRQKLADDKQSPVRRVVSGTSLHGQVQAAGPPIVVLDNGASTIKVGMAGEAEPRRLVQHAAVKPRRGAFLLGEQVDLILDWSAAQYNRPLDHGYVTNWALEQSIWDRIFGKQMLNITTKESSLLVTEPHFNPPSIRDKLDEVVFEKYGFEALCRRYPTSLAVTGYRAEAAAPTSRSSAEASLVADPRSFGLPCSVVVDCGYSFTHVAPMLDTTPVNYAVRRINVGGKLLTNYLKETISFRAWNVMDETRLIDDVKEKACLVSLRFLRDLKHTERTKKNKIRREFVMPNGSTLLEGYLRGGPEDPAVKAADKAATKAEKGAASTPDKAGAGAGGEAALEDQVLVMNNERIVVPELLFNPGDIGLAQAGLPETIVQAVEACPPEVRGLMYENILLVGGSAQFPNFRERVEQELRQLVPDTQQVAVYRSQKPMLTAWQGGSRLAMSDSFADECVTRAEYKEHGPSIMHRRFWQ